LPYASLSRLDCQCSLRSIPFHQIYHKSNADKSDTVNAFDAERQRESLVQKFRYGRQQFKS
jgi:hypothetical protein